MASPCLQSACEGAVRRGPSLGLALPPSRSALRPWRAVRTRDCHPALAGGASWLTRKHYEAAPSPARTRKRKRGRSETREQRLLRQTERFLRQCEEQETRAQLAAETEREAMAMIF